MLQYCSVDLPSMLNHSRDLDTNHFTTDEPTHAIFYSINSPHAHLSELARLLCPHCFTATCKHIYFVIDVTLTSFCTNLCWLSQFRTHWHAGGFNLGRQLIIRASAAVQLEHPSVTTLSTLSPLPGFTRWLASLLAEASNFSETELIFSLWFVLLHLCSLHRPPIFSAKSLDVHNGVYTRCLFQRITHCVWDCFWLRWHWGQRLTESTGHRQWVLPGAAEPPLFTDKPNREACNLAPQRPTERKVQTNCKLIYARVICIYCCDWHWNYSDRSCGLAPTTLCASSKTTCRFLSSRHRRNFLLVSCSYPSAYWLKFC